jgi:hypothetical protein
MGGDAQPLLIYLEVVNSIGGLRGWLRPTS